MKTTVFDGMTQDLGQVATRRRMVRLLGGVTALGTVAVSGRGEADAKRKKAKKITICFNGQTQKTKKKGFQTRFPGATQGACATGGACTPGRQIAQLQVPYNGVPVLTPVLLNNQTYTVQVSGAAATNATHSVDAEYDFITLDPNNQAMVTDIAVGWDVGLSIDDATPADMTKPTRWGPYNPAHVYSQQIIGQGRAASLLMLDSIYTDNSGFVTVTITCG